MKETPPVRIAFVQHQGPYWTLGPVFDMVREAMAKQNEDGPMFIRYHADPRKVSAAELKSDVGFVLDGAGDSSSPLTIDRRPAEKVAYVVAPGPHGTTSRFYALLYDWAKENGYQTTAGPIEVYWGHNEKGAVEIQLPITDAAQVAQTRDELPHEKAVHIETGSGSSRETKPNAAPDREQLQRVPAATSMNPDRLPQPARSSASPGSEARIRQADTDPPAEADVAGNQMQQNQPAERDRGPDGVLADEFKDLSREARPDPSDVDPSAQAKMNQSALENETRSRPPVTSFATEPKAKDVAVDTRGPAEAQVPRWSDNPSAAGEPNGPRDARPLPTLEDSPLIAAAIARADIALRFAERNFEGLAATILPDDKRLDPEMQVWVGQMAYRVLAVGRGLRQRFGEDADDVQYVATALLERWRTFLPTSADPLAVATRSTLKLSDPQQKDLLRRADLLLGRIAVGSTNRDAGTQEVVELLQEMMEILRSRS